MAMVKRVEGQIRRIEGFDVHFLYQGPGPQSGTRLRSDRTNVRGYEYERAARGTYTVAY
jgi:hypothetical protein